MYQHILISIDDSPTSAKALEKAIEIYQGGRRRPGDRSRSR